MACGDPGPINGGGADTPLGRVKARTIWENMYKHFTDAQNMSKALVKRFMDQLDPNATMSYEHERQRDPN